MIVFLLIEYVIWYVLWTRKEQAFFSAFMFVITKHYDTQLNISYRCNHEDVIKRYIWCFINHFPIIIFHSTSTIKDNTVVEKNVEKDKGDASVQSLVPQYSL